LYAERVESAKSTNRQKELILAQEYLEKAIVLQTKFQKLEALATSLNNLAFLYKSQGKYSEAEPLYLDALEMTKRLFTDDHPDVTNSLNNLALFYHIQGRYSEAEPLYFEALAMSERVQGTNHPNTIIFRDNLQILQQQLIPPPFYIRLLNNLSVLLTLLLHRVQLLIKRIIIFSWRLFRR